MDWLAKLATVQRAEPPPAQRLLSVQDRVRLVTARRTAEHK
ncbi:hypothetical protein ABZ235_04995 [Streptomyces canus]